MPLDDRLRSGLRDGVAEIDPDVERHLAFVTHGSRRGPRLLPATAMSLVALVGAVALLVVYQPRETMEPAASPSPVASPAPLDPRDALAGTYRVLIEDPAQGQDASLLGAWELNFDVDSGVTLTAPESFAAVARAPSERYVYALRGDSLSTNLLTRQLGHECASPGSYRWLMTDDGLRFEAIDDMCPQRVTILTTRDWTPVDG